MSVKIIQDKLESYPCASSQEEDHALKEITQELILNSLYNSGFFKKAAFQGGTALRILHGLRRFSEDLNFALIERDKKFDLNSYLNSVNGELKAFGYDIKIEGRTSTNAVQNTFLKDDSLGRLLSVQYPKVDGPKKSLKIKLEVDTHPPAGAKTETKFLDFPINFSVTTHDLPSLFAGKSHALLCRQYVKGRDWFDFVWYVGQKVKPNLNFLSNALEQLGPWKGKGLKADMKFYGKEMAKRIKKIDWKKAKADVERFLRPADVKTLELWNEDFFLDCLERLVGKPARLESPK
ncbi:MAG: nucleotidyl transferase AbiEii/AbiGii toxin family protein [Proteobacteria bacterium]|nr:nucleotidyl transferase AbiEii/AbiGii toxin family protein [Pseudomonadota bacterium]NDC23207.1 nucleotidyl transferase AbiEii/AbiGii toxin family protein [Pseudomonadota bacterium]NDD03522.1 nucleotidyl transferase AbiEii/AbiGii toxin family protein [Pseudomonadota bacterium]